MRLAATGRLAAPVSFAQARAAVATATQIAGLASLNVAIVLSPFRARIYSDERPLPPVFADYTDRLIFYAQVFIALAFALWLVSLLFQPRRIEFGPMLIWLPIAGLVAMVFAAVPSSPDEPLALFNAAVLLGFIAFGLYVANEVRRLAYILPGIGVMVVVQAVVAITQIISQQEFGLTAIGELDLDPERSGVSIVWTEGAPRLLRAYGLSDHPNILAGVFGAALLVVLGGIAKQRDIGVALLCGVFAVGVATVMVTFSRSGALGLASGLAFGFLLLLLRRDWRTLALWGTACTVAVMATLPLVRPYQEYIEARVNPGAQAVGSTEERSLTERNAVNDNTVEMIEASPLIGVGAGVLPTAMKGEYPDFQYHYQPAHIAIVTVAAEAGVPGAVAYGVLVLAPVALLWTRRRSLTPELIGVTGAWVALNVVGLFDYYTWNLMAGRLWFWLVLGLWVVAYRASERQAADA